MYILEVSSPFRITMMKFHFCLDSVGLLTNDRDMALADNAES